MLHEYTALVEEKTEHNAIISSKGGRTRKVDEAVII